MWNIEKRYSVALEKNNTQNSKVLLMHAKDAFGSGLAQKHWKDLSFTAEPYVVLIAFV